MTEYATQNIVRREYVGECGWDRNLAAIPDECLPDPALLRRLVDSARAEADSFESVHRIMIEDQHAEAENEHALAAQVTKESQERYDETDKQFAAAPGGSWLRGIWMSGLVALAVASEAILNGVLPYAMGATGLFATALMIAPAFVLPQILERVAHPLLASTDKFGRVAKGVLYSLVAVVILGSLGLIGCIRGIIGAVKNGGEATASQLQIINVTLLVLGIAVAVCAVIASYTAEAEFSCAWRFFQLQSRLKIETAELEEAREDELAAANRLSSAQRRFEARTELAQQYKNDFLASRLAMIEARLARIKTKTSVTVMLDLAEQLTVFRVLGLGWEEPAVRVPLFPHLREPELQTIA